MNRRDFLKAASGVAGGAAAAGAATPVGASEDATTTTTSGDGGGGTTTAAGTTTGTGTGTTNGTASGGGGGAAGPTEEVIVGPGGQLVYQPADLTIAPGTTVKFVWESDNHNVVPESIPDGATWEGTEGAPSATYNTGYEYSHTFTTVGTYEYFCQPHKGAGMEATITVQEGGAAAGAKELDPEHMGVPFLAHYVGIATILGIVASLVFAFYILKYGESPNASSPNRD